RRELDCDALPGAPAVGGDRHFVHGHRVSEVSPAGTDTALVLAGLEGPHVRRRGRRLLRTCGGRARDPAALGWWRPPPLAAPALSLGPRAQRNALCVAG